MGSLLRAALALDDACDAAAQIAGILAPAGTVHALVSIDPRDRLSIPPPATEDADVLARRWAGHGLTLTRFEPAGQEAIAATGSSWARRLGAGRDRTSWHLELRRPADAPAAAPADTPADAPGDVPATDEAAAAEPCS